MLKKMIIIVCLTSIIVSGCAGLADYDIDLPGNYSILRTSADEITIAPKTEIGWGPNVIPARVVAAGWNEKYIIAKQKVLESENEFYFWILNIETGVSEGPFNKNDFQKKREEYEISKDVELTNVEDFKKNK
ncbi:DUF3997 domain-containing protein [Lysinibacillus mangiferihumi]|uniref:DUF3997 domain-containing protein n=1 Tax=Lysinibacillus mangiferihumi TaxID=1130819 RepID=A0A4U2Y1A9_9BACI|nr:DUF3997 domain-containing protein [Lysinibacillus mangiferihumi]TKI52821.1 DUF3997 domain-containing protein [Lysinibacillus mangiferihumi]